MPLRSTMRVFGVCADLLGATAMAGCSALRSRLPRRKPSADLRAQFLIEGDPSKGLAPAARYRVSQYVPLFEQMGFTCSVRPSKPGKYFSAAASFQQAYARFPRLSILYARFQHLRQAVHRVFDFRRSRKVDVVLLQRDLLALDHSRLEDYLPLFNRHIVFDFDDAIFESPSWLKSEEQEAIDRERKEKIARICSLSSAVIAANPYLAEFARQYNDHVEVVPTTLCTEEFHPPASPPQNPVPVIGWIGTSGNLYYLKAIEPALQRLARQREFVLRVVCNRVPSSDLPELPPGRLEFIEWRTAGEVERIQEFDIGIMPLVDDEWTRGKAGFKLIQYMACGVPVVYSPVGANPDVAGDEGECGLAAEEIEDWTRALSRLIDDARLRGSLGERGRARAVAKFDRRIHAPTVARILEEVARDQPSRG